MLDGVSFADAAEVDVHALALQKNGAGGLVDLDGRVVDEWDARLNLLARRHRVVLIVVEFPHIGEGAKGHIKLAAGPFTDLTRGAQNLEHVRADRHRVKPGGGVDAQHIAAFLPDAQQLIQSIELGEDRRKRRCG